MKLTVLLLVSAFSGLAALHAFTERISGEPREKIVHSQIGNTPAAKSNLTTAAVTATRVRLKALKDYGDLPIGFERNVGQIDPRVKFVAHGGGYTLFLTDSEAVVAVQKNKEDAGDESEKLLQKMEPKQRKKFEARRFFHASPRFRHAHHSETVRIGLAAANRKISIEPLQELPGKTNYFVGADPEKWRTGIGSYRQIKYHEVYPGIDLVFYGTHQQLEFDFVVAPGADPHAITLDVQGPDKVVVAEDGGLSVDGIFGMRRPEVYQLIDGKRRAVSGRFFAKDHERLGIELGPYDHQQTLIIDPVLSYSTYLGGSGTDESSGIAVDAGGNAYIVGVTTSPNFPASNGYPSSATSNGTAFVAKLDPTGTTLLYSTYLGGTAGGGGNGIALDPGGHVYVTGYTLSSDFPVVNGLQTTLLNPNGSAFVARLDTSQTGASSLIYSTYLQGGGNSTNSLGDVGFAIAADGNGNAYVTGQTASDASNTSFPTTSSAYQSSLGSSNGNAFLTVLNTNQSGATSLVYSTYLGGASSGFGDYGMGVAVDGSGHAFITGQTTSGGSIPFPTTPTAYQSTLKSSNGNAFVTEIDPTQSGSQSLAYSTYFGGSSAEAVGDLGSAITLDSAGKVYFGGDASSADFPTTAGAFQTTNSSNGKAFAAKMDFVQSGSASLIFSSYVGGSDGQGEVANGIAVDAFGNAFLSGNVSSTDFPTTSQAPQSAIKSSEWNAFLTELNSSGAGLIFSTYWGGSCSTNGDLGFGIAVDSIGNPYLDGSTCSTDYVTYPNNAYQVSLAVSYDAFVAKFTPVTITSLVPSNGSVRTVVDIFGTNFGDTQGSSVVSFNGTTASVTSWSSTNIVATVPDSATSGNVIVTVSGAQSNGVPFTVVPPPIISGLSPASGSPGASVTISGSYFGTAQGQVSFNGTPAFVTSWADSTITASVPTGATTGSVTVTTQVGLTSNGVSFAVAPAITGLSLNSGPVGATITVSGMSFGATQGSSVVAFNGTIATVTNWTASSISTTVPAGATTGNVVVTVSGVNSNGINFRVLPPPVINGISPNLGQATTPVTIAGTGFGATRGQSTVTFNGVPAAVTSWSDTSLVSAVPVSATTGNVVVTLDGVASNGVNFTVAAPTLVSITLTPANSSTLIGATKQFTATGVYIDGSTQDLTASATWTSTNSSVATISTSGLATGLTAGQVSIQAVVGSTSASTPLTVGVFASGGTMNSARSSHTSTVLNSGQVLIAGGSVGSAELYDPTSQSFTTTGKPNVNRSGNTATLLNDGTVLLVGGFDENGNVASAEIYNPASGTFTFTGSLSAPRTSHSATLLNDGTVLIAGGFDSNFNVLASTEIYNPATGTFTGAGSMNSARVSPTSTLLNDGTVLVAGGFDGAGTALSTAEIFSPLSRTFTSAPSLRSPRGNHTATLLNGGTVLIAGGIDNNFTALAIAELYDPVAATFILTGSTSASRENHTATLLNNGQVLVAGGSDNNGSIFASTELYDPRSGTFTAAGNMQVSRFSHAASLLSNGSVLLTGGRSTNGDTFFAVNQAELYGPTALTPTGLVSIALSPLTPTNSVGTVQRFVATGTFNDSSTQVLASATWSSSDNTLATVTNDWTNRGGAFAVGAGSPTISACTGSICGSTSITVTAAQLSISGLVPASGSVNTPVTISGTAFGTTQGNSTVTFNGAPATVSSWSPTGIVATVPSSATSGNVIVTVSGTNSNGALFNITSAPVITGVSPSLGVAGTSVTITGSNFGGSQSANSVTFNGVVATPSVWTDGSITTTVPSAATTGNVIVHVSGVASNGAGFSVPSITYIAPQSGPPGVLVTIVGSGFGVTQGSGVVSIGSTAMSILSWSDTQILAAVGANTTSGTLTVQQGSLSLTGPTFTVNSTLPYNVSPASLNMVVGQTQTISVNNSDGTTVTGLRWLTTDPTIVNFSTDDPPVLTAIAPGSATIYAGAVPISVTVFSAAIPSGTPLWSLPLGNAELSIIPAVPSGSGADVFAIDGNGTLSAVTSDGKIAWQASTSGQVIPDFTGNAYLYEYFGCGTNCSTHRVVRLDPVTHTRSVLYTFSTVVDPGFSQWTDGADSLIPAQPYHYDRMGTEAVIPDTAGNLFVQDVNQVAVFNSTAQRIVTVPLDMTTITNTTTSQTESLPPAAGKMVVAGDGNAYIPYIYENVVAQHTFGGVWFGDDTISADSYLVLMRVSPDGTSARIQLDHQTATYGNQPSGCIYGLPDTLIFNIGAMSGNPFNVNYNLFSPTPLPISVITNADAGVAMISPPSPAGEGCSAGGDATLTYVSNDAVVGQVNLTFPVGNPLYTFWPQLQLEDGSFVGTVGDASQHAGAVPQNENSFFLANIGPGGVIWEKILQPQTGPPGAVIPIYATTDGSNTSIITTSSHNGTLGTLYTLDQNGNTIAQTPDGGAAYSWTNNWYVDPAGTLSRFASSPLRLMSTFAAFAGGNQSVNGTAIQQQWFPPLPSCNDRTLNPPVSCPGPQESIYNSFQSLRGTVGGSCPSCMTYVFSKLPGHTQKQFSQYLAPGALLFDGTHSTLRMDWFQCGNPFNPFNLLCPFQNQSVASYMSSNQATAISQTPSRYGKVLTFLDPSSICLTAPATPAGILNQATIFHEALHGFTGKYDLDLKAAFDIDEALSSQYITYYLEDNIFTGGSSTCGH
jgi:Bacterial Ig-like domain (group 2)/IPT/TIG domain/Beta-propeller repeat/Kelch motif/Galactose oxidase, central domain